MTPSLTSISEETPVIEEFIEEPIIEYVDRSVEVTPVLSPAKSSSSSDSTRSLPLPPPPPPPAPVFNIDELLNLIRDVDERHGQDNDGLHEHLEQVQQDIRAIGDLVKGMQKPADVQLIQPTRLIEPLLIEPELRSPPSSPAISEVRPVSIVESVPLRLSSPSSLYSSISFLSSHHSDDETLARSMSTRSQPLSIISTDSDSTDLTGLESDSTATPPLPPAQLPVSPLPPVSLPSSSSSSAVPVLLPLSPSSSATEPLPETDSEMAESMSSSLTARPAPAIGVVHLRDMIDNIRSQLAALSDGQRLVQERLVQMREEREPPVLDDSHYTQNLMQIQNLLNSILDKLAAPTPKPPPKKTETISSEPTISSITDSELRARWDRAHLEDILQPIPRRPTKFDDMTEDIIQELEPMPAALITPKVDGPPAFTPFRTVPERAMSPPAVSPPPRPPRSAPVDVPYISAASPFRRPPRPTRIIHFPEAGPPRVFSPEPTIAPTSRPPSRPPSHRIDRPIDFEQETRRLRHERGRGDEDGIFRLPVRPIVVS
jgi:hypothetical protein